MSDSVRELRDAIRAMLGETLMLPTSIDAIGDDQPLFGPGGLGLDSIDALQIAVALEKQFELRFANGEEARLALLSVATIAEVVARKRSGR